MVGKRTRDDLKCTPSELVPFWHITSQTFINQLSNLKDYINTKKEQQQHL